MGQILLRIRNTVLFCAGHSVLATEWFPPGNAAHPWRRDAPVATASAIPNIEVGKMMVFCQYWQGAFVAGNAGRAGAATLAAFPRIGVTGAPGGPGLQSANSPDLEGWGAKAQSRLWVRQARGQHQR